MITPRLVLVLCLAVAGCGQIPQPFRHGGAIPDIARPKMMRGLTVRPVEALPDGALLGDAVVRGLERHEIPAILSTGPAFGAVIEAQVARQDGQNGLEWVLRDADGTLRPIGFSPLPSAAWKSLDAAAARAHGDRIADQIIAGLSDPDAGPVKAAEPAAAATPTIRLAPFSGLPGDGDTALTAALSRALERAGLLPVASGGDYILEGRVTVVPGLPGEETVAVAWILKSGDGGELGVIDQEGVVPRGRLDSPWGALARDIAEGGAAGVAEALLALK